MNSYAGNDLQTHLRWRDRIVLCARACVRGFSCMRCGGGFVCGEPKVRLVRKNAELESALLQGRVEALKLKKRHRRTTDDSATSDEHDDDYEYGRREVDGGGRRGSGGAGAGGRHRRRRNGRSDGGSGGTTGNGDGERIRRIRQLSVLRAELDEATQLLERQERDIHALRAKPHGQQKHASTEVVDAAHVGGFVANCGVNRWCRIRRRCCRCLWWCGGVAPRPWPLLPTSVGQ